MAKFGRKSNSKFGKRSDSSSKRGGGSSRRGSSRRSRKNDSSFTRVGSVTLAKSTTEAHGEELIDELQDMEIQMWVNFYLPKGVKSMEVTNDTKMLISIKPQHEDTPDFVAGSVSIAEDED